MPRSIAARRSCSHSGNALRCVSKHEGISRPHPSRRAHACSSSRCLLSLRAPQDEDEHGVRDFFHHFKQPISFPRRVFAPGFCFFASLTPVKGWRSAERRTDACEASVGPALSGQARHLARRLASPYGGRPPPGAHTVAILGAGAALPLTGISAGSVTANSHIRVVVPGGGPCLPGRRLRVAAAGRHASLRLQDASGRRPLKSKAENLYSIRRKS
jgi:hypothetical protein